MRILHVITTLSRGGAEDQLVQLALRQQAEGHAVKVAYLKLEGHWRKTLQENGVKVVDLRAGSNANPAAARRLRRKISTFGPTLINSHMQPADLCVRLALIGRPFSSLPLIITRHNHEPYHPLLDRLGLGRWVKRRAQGIISVSDSVRSRCERQCAPTGRQRLTTIYNAIDTAPFACVPPEAVSALRRSWGAGPNDFVVGCAARLVPIKAIDVLMKGFSAFASQTAQPTRLVVVGTGSLERPLKKLAESLPHGGKIHFAGFHEDMPVVMNAFDLCGLTSDSEAFGVVLAEAMAAGRPVVATRVGGIPELVPDKTAGLLVPPRNPTAVAAALAMLVDPGLRQQMGLAGQRRVRELHGPEQRFQRTMSFYQECLS